MSFKSIKWDKYLADPRVIFDVGAFNGADAIKFKMSYPRARVIAFEAGRDNFNRYNSVCLRHGVELVHALVCDTHGKMRAFTASDDNHGCSGSMFKPTKLLAKRYPHVRFKRQETSVAISIGKFCGARKIPSVDLMHMDVQGAESLVMAGLGKIRPTFIFAEINAFDIYETGIDYDEFNRQMYYRYGYKIVEHTSSDNLYRLVK